MDPLSLTANVIAVLGAVRSALTGLEKLRRLRHTPQQLVQLSDEVFDFQTVLVAVEAICNKLSGEFTDSLFVGYFETLVEKASDQLDQVLAISNNCSVRELETKDESSAKAVWRQWWRRNDLQRLFIDIRRSRQDIAAALTVLTASDTAQIRNVLREIVLQDKIITGDLQRIARNTNNRIDSIGLEISKALSHAKQIHTSSLTLKSISGPDSKSISQNSHPSRHKAFDYTGMAVTQYNEDQCSALCMCLCHRPVNFTSPWWAKSLLGVILLSWTGVIGRPMCNEKRCQRSTTNMLKLQYYFPSWFLRRVLLLQQQFAAMEGLVVTIRTPRVVPPGSEAFRAINDGNIRVMQTFFTKGLASPFDVNELGQSYLAFSVALKQVGMTKFLLDQSADPRQESGNSQTPITFLWHLILVEPENPITQELKTLLDPFLDPVQDLQGCQFSTFHQIILGLAKLDLKTQLEVSTIGLDSRCSAGRTPLCWAIIISNKSAVELLLQYGGRIENVDSSGRNVFHYAVRLPDTGILELLLRTIGARAESSVPKLQNHAVVNPTLKSLLNYNISGTDNPLMRSAADNTVAHARLLLAHGASLDVSEEILALSDRPASPILRTVEWNSHEVLELLLQERARRDVTDLDEMGLLHLAGGVGDLRTFEILTQANLCCIDVTAKHKHGRTPLEEFDEIRPQFRYQDPENIRNRDRKAFLRLLASVKAADSDHVCTVRGFKRAVINDDLSEDADNEFFEAIQTWEESVAT